MPRVNIPFGEWTPDLRGLHKGLDVADNVLAAANGYVPVPSFVPEAGLSALPGVVLNAGAFRGSDRLTTLLAGTETGLFKRVYNGWEQIGSGYNAGYLNPWNFVQFGDRVICSNGTDAPVYFDLVTSDAAVELPGAPRFLLSTVVLDFIVTAVVGGDVGLVQWSGINNSEEWRPGYGQADYNASSSGGAITGLSGGEYGLILQEERISRMRYVGGNLIFQFDPISREIGCLTHRSVAQLGRLTFFLSPKGFMMCDGASVTPIGDQKVDQTFLDAMDVGRIDRMSAAIDPIRKLVVWSLPEEEPGVLYAYSWTLGRWSRIVQPVSCLFGTRERDIAIGEDYDPDMPDDGLIGSGTAFGDPVFRGSGLSLGVFDDGGNLGGFSGPNMAATFRPAEAMLGGGRAARVRMVRPVGDMASGVSLRLNGRLRMGDAMTETLHSGMRESGDIPVRREVRSGAFELDVAAGAPWSFAQGLEVEFERGSGR